MKKVFAFLFTISSYCAVQAQVSESCNCLVDTLGYAAFVDDLNPNENAAFQFHVNGTFAVAYGVIDGTTPTVVQDLIDNSPTVTTIVMLACPGSQNDVANLQASELIYNKGYKMYLPQGGWIASGATDMFLAGSTRVVEVTPDAVGVHSWSDGTSEATDFPVGHELHQPYIDYYVNIGFSVAEAEAFYYYTIDASPASDVHWMTETELDQYKVRTCKYSDNPDYSVSQYGSVLTADLSGANYQWINCDTDAVISGETNQSFTPGSEGNYAVEVTEEGCMGTSTCFSVMNIGIIDNNFATKLSSYPNPSTGDFSINLGDSYEKISVKIMDLSGRLLSTNTYQNKQLLNIQLQQPAGLYLLVLETTDNKAVIQLLKK